MADDRDRSNTGNEPFRESESGDSYNPQGNWGAERRDDNPSGGIAPGQEGAPSGAGYGGFGPEGDYAGAAGKPNADVVGEVNADPGALEKEAHKLGTPTPGRAQTGGNRNDPGAR